MKNRKNISLCFGNNFLLTALTSFKEKQWEENAEVHIHYFPTVNDVICPAEGAVAAQ